jgi:hypothetical protein
MFIIIFSGGLGNQIFQYNFLKYIEETFPIARIAINTSSPRLKDHGGFLLNIKGYDIQNHYNKGNFRYITEKTYHDNISPNDNIVFSGFWQDPKFFPKRNLNFHELFGKIHLSNKNSQYLDKINSCTNSVSIHIRRGDYVNNPLYCHITTINYFNNAINYTINKLENPCFFIFSDDIDWAKSQLIFMSVHHFFIKNANTNKVTINELYLMSRCKNNIISHSSFSWWAQQFNTNPGKIVITPEYWINEKVEAFNTIVPPLQKLPCMISVPNINFTDKKCSTPFFSVILTINNKNDCFYRAIASVFNQEFKRLELIIIHDKFNEFDNSLFMPERYLQINKNIISFPNAKHISSHISRRKAVESVNGQYVLFLDGNDYFLENSLSELYKMIRKTLHHDVFEFKYIDQTDSQVVLIPNLKNRFLLLFDNYSFFLPTVLNGAYNSQMLKTAFKAMCSLHIDIPINLYEFSIICFIAKNVLLLDNITTAIGSTGGDQSDNSEDLNYSVEYIKSMKTIYDSLNYFLQSVKLDNLTNSFNFRRKIFYHITRSLLKKQINYTDKTKLLSILSQYFPELLYENHFQNTTGDDNNCFESRKFNLKYLIFKKYNSLVPNRIKRFIQKRLITFSNEI